DQSDASQAIVKQLTSVTSTGGKNPTTIKWSVVKNKTAVMRAMDKQKYYGALVIKAGFAQDTMSLATTNPTHPEMQVIINQAKNATAAAGVQNALTMMTNKVGSAMANQV
ncbi:SNG1 family protein, partial [Weissella cibaria]